jgi:hypothetical protein
MSSLENVVSSTVELNPPIYATIACGTPVVLQHVGSVANYFLTIGIAARDTHPELWAKAGAALVNAAKPSSDDKTVQAAIQATYDLLKATDRMR